MHIIEGFHVIHTSVPGVQVVIREEGTMGHLLQRELGVGGHGHLQLAG